MKCHVWGRHIETREYIGSYKASTKKRIKEEKKKKRDAAAIQLPYVLQLGPGG
jgi:hypothetical protein